MDLAEPGTDVLGKLAALLRLQPLRLTGSELLQKEAARLAAKGATSDDLSMAAASIVDRCTATRKFSCDMLLVCNSIEAVGELLTNWRPVLDPLRARRVDRPFSCHYGPPLAYSRPELPRRRRVST